MLKNEFIAWAAKNGFENAYFDGETYSHVPYEIGCAYIDGIFDVYEVDERGVPESFIRTNDESKAYFTLSEILLELRVRKCRREGWKAGNDNRCVANKTRVIKVASGKPEKKPSKN